MRIVFMGTPDFAVPALRELVNHHEVAAVVTQPDKPKGRGKNMQFPPVKEEALLHDIPVIQPVRVRGDEAFYEEMKAIRPDVIVVAAFGQILPESILNLPRLGCINIHASLLPKYRGAGPIQWSILDGEAETGVTTMYMAKGLDTGDMLEKTVVPIDPKETGGSLSDKLSAAGGKLILSTLQQLEEGTAKRIVQDDSLSCYAKMLDKTQGVIDWNQDARSIERLIRGLNPWPSAYTKLNGKTLKIWDADVMEGMDSFCQGTEEANTDQPKAPGTVIKAVKTQIIVQTKEGYLLLNEVQLEGKKRMKTDAFLLGYPVEAGIRLGQE